MKPIHEKLIMAFLALATVAVCVPALFNPETNPHLKEPAAAAYVPQTRGYEVTCGSTATSLKPTDWSTIHSVTCAPSKETPDDSGDCVCIGASDLNDTDECFPVGGCSRAIQASIAIDGSAYCMREDGAADVVLVCLAGRGSP